MTAFHTLVIACGNPLRGDDGVGPAAAEIVKSWQTPGVKTIAVHQLIPELIEEMKQVERVLFIDAALNDTGHGAFDHCGIEPKKSRCLLGHHQTSANLLALLQELEGRAPRAWLVSISAISFDHGDSLTERARNHVQAALEWIHAFLAEPLCTKSA